MAWPGPALTGISDASLKKDVCPYTNGILFFTKSLLLKSLLYVSPDL